MHLPHYLGLAHGSEVALAAAFREVAAAHAAESDVRILCEKLARQCDQHAETLAPFFARYGNDRLSERDVGIFRGPRAGGLGLLRDLHDLYLLASDVELSWRLIGQAAQAARDAALLVTARACEGETARQIHWLRTRLKEAAPQALLVAS